MTDDAVGRVGQAQRESLINRQVVSVAAPTPHHVLGLLSEGLSLMDRLERLSDRVLTEPTPSATVQAVWAVASVENKHAVEAWRAKVQELLP
jgi:hypothetical protein